MDCEGVASFSFAKTRIRSIQTLELHMNIWPVLKIALIIIATVGSVFDTSYAEFGNKLGWEPIVAGLLFFPSIVLVGVFILKVIFRRKLGFEEPSWRSNPLDFSHPEHFCHLAGMVLLISGGGGFVANYFRSGEWWPVLFAPGALGLGVLIGIWFLKVVYVNQSVISNNKIQPTQKKRG